MQGFIGFIQIYIGIYIYIYRDLKKGFLGILPDIAIFWDETGFTFCLVILVVDPQTPFWLLLNKTLLSHLQFQEIAMFTVKKTAHGHSNNPAYAAAPIYHA